MVCEKYLKKNENLSQLRLSFINKALIKKLIVFHLNTDQDFWELIVRKRTLYKPHMDLTLKINLTETPNVSTRN